MNRLSAVTLLAAFLIVPLGIVYEGELPTAVAHGLLRCVAFSPYVQGYDAEFGPHPPPAVIDQLLNVLITQTDYRCIKVFGVLDGLDYIAQAAQKRGLKVFQIIWLGTNFSDNDKSIERGIQLAKTYPKTIVRLSCGSEVRSHHGHTLDSEIKDCINRLKAAGVAQPITTIDSWWEWCMRPVTPGSCTTSDLAPLVSWIGINVFPWWENTESTLFPCTTAAQAPQFHIDRMQNVMRAHPGKTVILTEFGWPAGPSGHTRGCGTASKTNQDVVIKETIRKLDERGWQGVIFEAFKEPWKKRVEGVVGDQWGRCAAALPYTCTPTFFRY